MPLSQPITPGVVDWTGENPGILLKNDDGSFSAMSLFFRIAWSPVGQGQVMLIYGTPDQEQGTYEAPNVILSDNEKLSHYLLDNFIGRPGVFRDAPAFNGLNHLVAQSIKQKAIQWGIVIAKWFRGKVATSNWYGKIWKHPERLN